MGGIDRRYQVFISSTFNDLAEQRKQAIEVIHQLGHIPIALESFRPSNRDDLETISSVMSDCQVYLLILGHRYGSLVEAGGISYTELEYNLAKEKGLFVLTLVLESQEIQKRRSALNSENTLDIAELAHFDRLKQFHARIKEFKQVWKPDDQFKYLVSKALLCNLPNWDRPGFVREEQHSASQAMASAARNDFIVDTVTQLESFKKLHERCSQEEPLKREVARFFVEQYSARIIKHRVSIFLESGSTVAYVARELGRKLSGMVRIEEGRPNIQISTNNVLAYLQLWLSSKIPCQTFPWSPPSEQTYGALYGGLEVVEEKKPVYDLSPLDDEAREEIRKLCQAPFGLIQMARPTLLLGAASGLQMTSSDNVSLPNGLDEVQRNSVLEEVRQCFGPHIASYRNKIFKRFMYATHLPLVIFLTESKINSLVRVGESHFVLDRELTWEKFYQNHPLAFCVGGRQDNLQAKTELLEELGFHLIMGSRYSEIGAFVARNQKFIDEFESQTPFSP